jgi:hypothetical protein
MQYPKKSSTAYVETLDDELCIYDWERKEVHALNRTAALVWDHCDGRTSPAQIAQTLQAELNVPYAEEMVWMSLDRLEKARLLENGAARLAGHKPLTRRQMLKGLGVAVALLPVVSSIVAPSPMAAQSPIANCIPPNLTLGATRAKFVDECLKLPRSAYTEPDGVQDCNSCLAEAKKLSGPTSVLVGVFWDESNNECLGCFRQTAA